MTQEKTPPRQWPMEFKSNFVHNYFEVDEGARAEMRRVNGITKSQVYQWRKQLQEAGAPVPALSKDTGELARKSGRPSSKQLLKEAQIRIKKLERIAALEQDLEDLYKGL
jgi:transposase-like protein